MKINYIAILLLIISHSLYAQNNNEKLLITLLFNSDNILLSDISSQKNTYDNITKFSSGSFKCIAEDSYGAELYSTYFNPPQYIYYDSFDGQSNGGRIKNDHFYYTLELPLFKNIYQVRILKDNISKLNFVVNKTNINSNQKKHLSENGLIYPYTTILNSGHLQNRINLVLLGDGYTNLSESFIDKNGNGKRDGDDYVDLNQNGIFDNNEPYIDNNNNYKYDTSEVFTDINNDGIFNFGEQQKYKNDVDGMINYLFGKSIFGKYKNHFNVYRIDDMFSEQAGADHNYNNPKITRNTILNSFYYHNIERLLLTDYSIVNNIIKSSIPELGNNYIVIVLVNSPKYGGSGGSISVTYNGTSGYEVMVHELGHTLTNLADEYDYGSDPNYALYTGAEPTEPNVTTKTVRNEIKWKEWINESTPLPTPATSSEIGLFEGAYYYAKGIFRPSSNCKMRTLNTPFCSVCNNAIIKTMYSRNNVIDSYSPITDTVIVSSLPVNFSLSPIEPSPNSLAYKWFLNGNEISGKNKDKSLDYVPIGNNILTATVSDTTYLNKIEVSKFERSRSWVVINNSVTSAHNIDDLPKQFSLSQNYPNPFNPSTSIRYFLPEKCFITLKIFDVLGKEITTLVYSTQNQGEQSVIWNAASYPSGIYFYQLITPHNTYNNKMILTK